MNIDLQTVREITYPTGRTFKTAKVRVCRRRRAWSVTEFVTVCGDKVKDIDVVMYGL